MDTLALNRRDYESISSIINPSISIQYNERVRDRIDENHVGYVKSVTIYGKPFKIILGKTNFRVSINQKMSSIVYFNIYRDKDKEVKEKIGVFEAKPTELSDIIGTLDITNNIYDIDVSKFRRPIFFRGFISQYFPDKRYDQLKENRFRETPLAQQVRKRKKPVRVDGEATPPLTDRGSDAFTDMQTTRRGLLDTDRTSLTSIPDTRRGITERAIQPDFMDQGIQTSLSLEEKPLISDKDGTGDVREGDDDLREGDDAAREGDDDLREGDDAAREGDDDVASLSQIEKEQERRYVPSIDDNWIQKKFKNKGFEMAKDDNNGTALFDVLEKVFTTQNIRESFSNAITQEHLSRYTKLYTNLKNGIEGVENKQRRLAVDIKSLKGKDEQTKEKRKQLRKILKNTKKKLDDKKAMLKKYRIMESIQTEEDLKNFVKQPDFWGDSLAITFIEGLLYKQKVKIIVLLEDRNEEHKLNNVVSCNNYNRIDVDSYKTIKPSTYVILSLKDTEYTLVRFNGKERHKFSELPYMLKRKLMDNCVNIA